MTTYNNVFGGSSQPPSQYGYQAVTIAVSTQAYWPYNTAGAALTLAKSNDVTASVASLHITLPDATQVSTGEDFVIKNVGSNSFDVYDFGGNNIATITAGVAKYFNLSSNTTTAGVYSLTTFGTGTSAADATALAGAGLYVASGKLASKITYTACSTSYVVSAGDNSTILVYTAGATSWALLNPAGLFNGFYFWLTNEGTGGLTLTPTGATIDGVATKIIQPGESCLVSTNGTNYVTAGYGRSNIFSFTQLTVDTTGLTAYTVTTAQAANKLWNFTNTPAGAMTVTIPAVASVYYLKVGASGAYSLTFTTGSGASVALTANQNYIIYCDGTNVTAAQTVAVTSALALSDGSVAAPSASFSLEPGLGLYRDASHVLGVASNGAVVAKFGSTGITYLAGALPVAYGGTGVTTSTGTGSTVLSTNPTLITPTLGVAVATTVNKVTLTAPATGSTLTIADGKTLTASNTLTLTGADAKTWNLGLYNLEFTTTADTTLTLPTSGTLATTAGTIANATNVGITDDTTTNAVMYPTWVTAATGDLPAKVSSTKCSFNPSTGTLTATAFSGNLTGNVTGNASTATSATSATSATTATNLAGGSSGAVPYQTAAGTTAFATPLTLGQVLGYISPGVVGGVVAPASSTAISLANGTAGQVVYQVSPGVTGFLSGTSGQALLSGGTGAPTFTSGTGVLKQTAGVLGVAANSDLPTMTATVGGAVPTPPNNTTTFLRGDGTFNTPAGVLSGNAVGIIDMTAYAFNEAHGADIASATTTNLDTATGNLVDVTGTTTITGITLSDGHRRTVRFTGACLLTNGASLVLPGGANITTAAGDFAEFYGYAAGVVRCVTYTKAAGTSVISSVVPSGATIYTALTQGGF